MVVDANLPPVWYVGFSVGVGGWWWGFAEGVVDAAEGDEVVAVRRAAVLPGCDVVEVAVAQWCGAAGEGAAAVA